jgi:ParB-like chromosome segregation protein Spo0J
MILSLDLNSIDENYMVRDRVEIDEADMQALLDSLAARGQQVPVEVMDLKDGTYGLISGWRRLVALRKLYKLTGDARFAKIQALNRTADTSSDVYLAMVEENEIRSGVSFYERARIAVRASDRGVYDSPKAAVRALFAAAPRAKRSKINSFVTLYEAFGDALRFPSALSEKQGLMLAKAVRERPAVSDVLRSALTGQLHETAKAEQAALKSALLDSGEVSNKAKNGDLRPMEPAGSPQGKPVYLRLSKGKLVLDGTGVTAALEADLRAWLASRR